MLSNKSRIFHFQRKERNLFERWRCYGNSNNAYWWKFFFCLFFGNGFALFIFWRISDWVFYGKFQTYGSDFVNYYWDEEYSFHHAVHPFDYVFPKVSRKKPKTLVKLAKQIRIEIPIFLFQVTACDYQIFGYNGNKENHNAQCVLNLNILNEKVFLVLWFLYVLLGIVLAAKILAYILFTIPYVKKWMVASDFGLRNEQAWTLISDCTNGDIFVLYGIKDNVFPSTFKNFIDRVVEDIRNEQRKRNDGSLFEDVEDPDKRFYSAKQVAKDDLKNVKKQINRGQTRARPREYYSSNMPLVQSENEHARP